MSAASERLAASYLRKAAEKRDAGDELGAVAMEEAADMAGATCPHCGGYLIGSFPIDGREVDQAPEPHHWWIFGPAEAGVANYEMCRCLLGQDHAQDPITEPTQPAAARQIVRDEATRKALDNHEEK